MIDTPLALFNGVTFNLDFIIRLALGLLAILIGLVVHEYGHAWAAMKRGDDTAKLMGRMHLAPERHLDPFMSFFLPIALFVTVGFIFGGAKPVPVNPSRLRNPDSDMVFVAIMGPVFQMFVATSALVALLLLSPFVHPGSYGFLFLQFAVLFNVIIAFFNLIPIPPLDGSRILRYYMPLHLRAQYDSIGPMAGFAIIILLSMGGFIGTVLGPVASFIGRSMFEAWKNFGLHNLTGPLLW